MKKLLGIFAHPDDETLMAGGTIAKYVKAGWKADIVCATRGEEADRGAFDGVSVSDFAGERSAELESAAATLGVTSITFLEYRDGKLSSVPTGELEDKLSGIFSAENPDVVITAEPAGITNDPDHVRLTNSVTYAFQKYADLRASEFPDDPNPPKLYYACEPESIVTYLRKHRYYPGETFGKPRTGVADKKITTVIDISRTSAVKAKALKAYVSQEEPVAAYLSIPNNPFMSQEYYIARYEGRRELFMGKNDRVSDRL